MHVGTRSHCDGKQMSGKAEVRVFELDSISKQFRGRASLLDRLRRRVPITYAVQSVSLTVIEHEVLGIIGESGSGKSTLGYLCANLESPSSGTIRFHRKAIGEMGSEQRKDFRRKVQVIFQDSTSSLNPRRRVLYTITDALRLAGVPRERRTKRTSELAELVGLSTSQLRSYPHELSGGQRQRIGIARALAMNPEVLIADEPVSALDVSLQGQILNLLMDLRKQFGLTIVLISHDIAVVKNVSDRICVMYGGRMVEAGAADQVIRCPKHPYTKDLIASVPKGVPGTRPDLERAENGQIDHSVSEGCPYTNRCANVMAHCRSGFPDRAYVGENHWVACNLFTATK